MRIKGSVSRSGDRSRGRGLGGDTRKETRGRGSRGNTSSGSRGKVPSFSRVPVSSRNIISRKDGFLKGRPGDLQESKARETLAQKREERSMIRR